MSDIVLSYKDSVIRKFEIDILKNGEWLNDTIISFWFDYLEELIIGKNASVAFLSASLSQLIKLSDNCMMPLFLDCLHIDNKDLILLPVNDYMETGANGGSHWSLLLFSKRDNEWYHYDSLGNSNTLHALSLQTKLCRYLGKPLKELNQALCNKQSNSSDCGLFAIAFAEFIVLRSYEPNIYKSCFVNEKHLLNYRQFVIDTIFSLKNKK